MKAPGSGARHLTKIEVGKQGGGVDYKHEGQRLGDGGDYGQGARVSTTNRIDNKA